MNRLNPPQMFLQPRSKDKRIVAEALGHYDGFQVSATVPAATLSHIRDIGKPFFVDPMAYMFALPPDATIDPKTQKVRSGVSVLANRYGSLLKTIAGKRALSAGDFLKYRDAIDEVTDNALAYAREKLGAGDINLFNPYLDKYAQLAMDGDDIPHSSTAITPWALIPPYFHFSDIDSDWYRVSLACARAAVRHKRDREALFPTIFMSPDILDFKGNIDQILLDFDEPSFDGYFIWINDFSEEGASPERLANLIRLVSGLKALGKRVFKFHGGFFSILIHDLGLDGFSCGLGGRTDRNVFSYKWVAPKKPILPKFYVPSLHRVYPLEEAAQLMKMFPFLRCQCAACSESYGNNLDAFTNQMKEPGYCERHFLNVRKQEVVAALAGTSAMVEQLSETISQFTRKNAPGTRHLTKWRELLASPQLFAPVRQSLQERASPTFLPSIH